VRDRGSKPSQAAEALFFRQPLSKLLPLFHGPDERIVTPKKPPEFVARHRDHILRDRQGESFLRDAQMLGKDAHRAHHACHQEPACRSEQHRQHAIRQGKRDEDIPSFGREMPRIEQFDDAADRAVLSLNPPMAGVGD
jgi:hypothetical protein